MQGPTASQTTPSPSGLLERAGELELIDGLIRGLGRGRAGLALIEGPAGIGKTRLLIETRRLAESDGLRILTARGSELEREFPFGIVRQLFEPELADTERRERLLQGAAAGAGAVFDPSLSGLEGEISFSALHGLYWLVVGLSSEEPLTLAVDDLHWCDRASLRFLAYLARRLEDLPVLLAASVRPAEPGADLALIGELANDPLAELIRPGPLSRAAVGGMIEQRLESAPDEAFLATCHSATGGNPLLLGELLKALSSEQVAPRAANLGAVRELGPRAASRAVLTRLARLRPEARTVARAAAVLGDGSDTAAIAGLAGVEERTTAEALTALAGAEVVSPEPPLEFVHPLVRDAVYRDIPPGEREILHGRAARALSDAGAASERIAAHLLAMPRRGEAWAVETLREAARAAQARGGADSAAAYLRRALEEPPPRSERTGVLLELGYAEALTSGPAASEHLREAYDSITDPRLRARLAGVLARALVFTGHGAEATEIAETAARELPDEQSDMRRRLEATAMIMAFFGHVDPSVLDASIPYREKGGEPGLGTKMLKSVAAMHWAYSGGPADACAALAHEALAGGELAAAEAGFMAIGATLTLAICDRPEAPEALEELLAQAHRAGSMFAISGVHLWQGFCELRRGDLAEAEGLIRAARDEFALWGYARYADIYANGFLASILVERGRVAEARETLGLSADPGDRSDGARFYLNAEMELLLAEGHAERALEVADEFSERFRHVVNPAEARWRTTRARALEMLGRNEEARAAAAEELELSLASGAPGTVGHSQRLVAELDEADRIERLGESVATLEGSTARLELARSLAALGSAIRLERKPRDAREPLRRAYELADRCGADGLAEHIRSELGATGARPRTTALSGVESLTASELRVARFAAEGQTNRDIAQTLFVTPKTVEVHLTNSYRKLGIGSRRELAAALDAPA